MPESRTQPLNFDGLEQIKQKSEDDFEKNITYISAGTLILSLTFIEKIVPLSNSGYIGLLIWGWAMLALTLVVNLGSHLLSSYYSDKCREEFEKEHAKCNENLRRRNKIIRIINISTLCTLLLGITFLILFCTKNAYKMSTIPNKELNDIKPQTHEVDVTKGRTLSSPTTNTGSNSGQTNNGNNSNQNTDSNTGNKK
jgi:hypothetical protein